MTRARPARHREGAADIDVGAIDGDRTHCAVNARRNKNTIPEYIRRFRECRLRTADKPGLPAPSRFHSPTSRIQAPVKSAAGSDRAIGIEHLSERRERWLICRFRLS